MVLPNGVHLLHPVPFYGNESDPQAFINTQQFLDQLQTIYARTGKRWCRRCHLLHILLLQDYAAPARTTDALGSSVQQQYEQAQRVHRE
eukprot:2122423-Rhodomonas_salina.1